MGFEPRLRHDQLPERYVYLNKDCARRLDGLGLAPGEEEAEPHPKEQAHVLLNHFCGGGDFVLDHDYMRRGSRPLWMWKTRSLRMAGVYLSRACFVLTGLEYKAAFTAKAGERLKQTAWHKACFQDVCALGLKGVAFEGDPHADEAQD